MGLYQRKLRNESNRELGNEPEPGLYAGVRRRARFLKRNPREPVKVKNPNSYLNSCIARRYG